MTDHDEVLRELDRLLEQAEGDAKLLDAIRARVAAVSASTAASAAAGGDGGGDGDGSWHGMLGTCDALLSIRHQAQKFADADVPILIRGESGTGKDVLAKILHQIGPRAEKPFVSENCAAIPENLLESVLFGHEKGSFTGAIRDHDGHFVTADGGSLFLDEIGDMPLPMQSKMLRVLQEGEVRRIGSSKIQKVDVRILAATNQDLEAMVSSGRFREDLYYRLNVLQLYLPPLRERGDDVLMLARHFLAAAAAETGRTLHLDPAAEAAVARAAWPGNARQLQNEMQRASVLAPGPAIRVEDLSAEIR